MLNFKAMDKPDEKNKKVLKPNEKAKASQLDLKAYEQKKSQEAKKQAKAFRLPKPILMVLSTPLLLIFLLGLLMIPYMIYTFVTAPHNTTQNK